MASVSQRSSGTFIVRFINERRRRKTITIGKSERKADETCRKIEDILTAKKLGLAVDPQTAAWLSGLPEAMRKRLASVGLIEGAPEQASVITLGKLLEDYFTKRTDAKPGTLVVLGQTRRNLLEFFGADKPLTAITAADAKDFERYLRTTAREHRYAEAKVDDGLKPDTVRKRISNSKQFFADAVDRELIDRNPFAKLKSTVKGNRERDFFITREMATKLIEAAPDAQWRAIIALSRYGGLRCPSEHLGLRLDDIDWERERIRITSPKTEHHEGKAYRFIPLFPELLPYLRDVDEQAPPGTEYVITRYRSTCQNLRTTFLKIIKRAGLTPWPKLFHNMRATRQTELEEQFPSHVVCAWIGNSPAVAKRHYLQVTDEHFAKAANVERAQNVAKHALQSTANGKAGDHKTATYCDVLQSPAKSMTPTGLEEHSETAGKQHSEPPRSIFVATANIGGPSDPRLAILVERWERLPEEAKIRILTMAEACTLGAEDEL